MSGASESFGRRFRDSFRKKKKKKGDQTGASGYQKDRESLDDLIQSSKTLLKSISKKQKKQKREQIEANLTDLNGCMDTVKQRFVQHGKQNTRTDWDFGFHNDESRNRSGDEQVEVYSRERDHIADYSLSQRGRDSDRPRNRSQDEQVDVHSRERDPMTDYNLSLRGRDSDRLYTEGRRPFKRSLSVDEPSKRSAKRLQDVQVELKVREDANDSLQKKIKKLQDELARNERELDKEIKTREDAQNRLSELMGRQLKSNNPAITDLSDPDRPLNLVDKFCNIYDNEWTDVIDEIENSTNDERTAVKILLTLVCDAYTECYKLRQNGQFFIGVENRSATVKGKIKEIPEDCRLLLKTIDASQLDSLKQFLLNRLQSDVNRHTLSCLANKPYIIKCLELCWMMVCNTPPIHLEWNYKGCAFDTSILKPFTEPGVTVKFMVWPVVFLHKDGPLLYKGVAQGCDKKQHTQF